MFSFYPVIIDGNEKSLAIINTDDFDKKTICSVPGDEIIGGSLVLWQETYWLVTEIDANNELYAKASMERCNHRLRWISSDGRIIERWSIVSDGTKYMIGETTGVSGNSMTLGDTRIAVAVARDAETVKLNRSYRFLIDDEDSNSVLAYRLSKPFKIGGVHNGHGVMHFIMSECNSEDDDNFDLRIADYYKHFPRTTDDRDVTGDIKEPEDGKKVWL